MHWVRLAREGGLIYHQPKGFDQYPIRNDLQGTSILKFFDPSRCPCVDGRHSEVRYQKRAAAWQAFKASII